MIDVTFRYNESFEQALRYVESLSTDEQNNENSNFLSDKSVPLQKEVD